MKNIFILIAFFVTLSTANSQEIVSTSGNTNDVYYNFADKSVGTASNTEWDIAFETKGFTGSILINGGSGTKLYSSPYPISDWSAFDTSGYKTWTELLNSRESWSKGAFSQNSGNQFDLGWGKYDINTHAVKGDSIFLLELADGSLKKIYIKDLTSGTYNFVYADADGSNEMTQALKTSDYSDQNFAYYTFSTDAALSHEPASARWDIVFTKYIEPIPVGGGLIQNYPVGGVKINKGVEVAERSGVDVSSNDTSTLNWSTNLTEIGSDWKQFDGTKYVITPDLAYFVRTQNGAVWKIYFTDYEGGSLANYHFNKELIAMSSVASHQTSSRSVYPNPVQSGGVINVDLKASETISNASVINVSGQSTAVNFDQMGQIDISNFSTGLYYLSLDTNLGSYIQPIVIK